MGRIDAELKQTRVEQAEQKKQVSVTYRITVRVENFEGLKFRAIQYFVLFGKFRG